MPVDKIQLDSILKALTRLELKINVNTNTKELESKFNVNTEELKRELIGNTNKLKGLKKL